jgi:hypothetical protein
MKSILHDKTEGTCFLCKKLHDDWARKSTTEHHVIHGTAGRQQAEKYGLKVYLCFQHHGSMTGEDVHRPDLNNYDQILRVIAQKKWEAEIGSREDWIRIFGKSNL